MWRNVRTCRWGVRLWLNKRKPRPCCRQCFGNHYSSRTPCQCDLDVCNSRSARRCSLLPGVTWPLKNQSAGILVSWSVCFVLVYFFIFSGGLCSYWLACFTLKSSYRHIEFVSFFLSSSSSCSSFHSFFPFVFAANWKCLMPHWHLVWPHWNVVYATHTHWNMYPLPYIVVTAQELC